MNFISFLEENENTVMIMWYTRDGFVVVVTHTLGYTVMAVINLLDNG